MTRKQDSNETAQLQFYATMPRDCSYLDARQAVSVFADPGATLTQSIYDRLSVMGFRRSGNDLYRPACPGCSACVPLRVPVPYQRSHSQQRCWKRNQDLTVRVLPADFQPQHYDLFQRYLQARHATGGMTDSSEKQYMEFLASYWSETYFIEFTLDETVLAVAVTDYLDDALSAVYTFFDPQQNRRSLGSYCILYQLALAEQLEKNHVYLGYWIEACQAMRYKTNFQPCEIFQNGRWELKPAF